MSDKPKPSPAEKAQRKLLLNICNSIASDFSFGKVKTWRDVYVKKGETVGEIEKNYAPEHLQEKVLFPKLKEYFAGLQSKLEAKLANADNESRLAEERTKLEDSNQKEALSTPLVAKEETKLGASDNYGLPELTNCKAYLFWFQKKALKEMLDLVLGFDVSICKNLDELKAEFIKRGSKGSEVNRGVMLLAGTGTGKTYMIGALVYVLHYIGFTTDKTLGPIEYLYITRASIVEQTRRVFQYQFGLRVTQGVEVLNIEQLRSKAGQLWCNEKCDIVEGKEVYSWVWRKLMNPVVLLLDECQSVMNEDSTQSQIVQAFADIPTPCWVYFISASPFARVSGAKAFVVNCHLVDETLV